MKASKIPHVFQLNLLDPLFFSTLSALGAHHNRCTVCIIGTDIDALIATQFLKSYPDISLDVFYEMAKVNGAISVGQGGGYEYATGCRHVGTVKKSNSNAPLLYRRAQVYKTTVGGCSFIPGITNCENYQTLLVVIQFKNDFYFRGDISRQ